MIIQQEFKPGPNCPNAKLEVISARILRVISPGSLYLSSGILYSNDAPIASEGSNFTFLVSKGKKITYPISAISLSTPHAATLSTERRNMTSMFLLPAVELEQASIGYDTYLINAYCPVSKAQSSPFGYTYNNQLDLVYRYFPLDAYRELEKRLLEHPNFLKIRDSRDKVIISMNVPEKFHADIQTLIKGRYSKLSNELKSRILRFHGVGRGSNLYSILHREESFRQKMSKDLGFDISPEAELYDIPVLQEEHLEI